MQQLGNVKTNVGLKKIVEGAYLVGFEDIEEGRRSQRKVATLRFNAAVFGHGRPIHSGASERIRSKWGR